jgi:hypothetical protein
VRGPRRLVLVLVGALALVVMGAGLALAAPPLPLWQRVLLGGEYEGFSPQARPPAELTLTVFVRQTKGAFVRITPPILIREMRRDGYRAAVIEELTGPQKRSAISAVLRFDSSAGAARALSFFHNDSLRPCPNTCTVSAFVFQVPGIPGAKGSRRVRFKAEGKKPGQGAFEEDTIQFTSGPFAYSVISSGEPNGVDRTQMIAAARRLYDRVKGSPPVGS